jgi:hypothetical protein
MLDRCRATSGRLTAMLGRPGGRDPGAARGRRHELVAAQAAFDIPKLCANPASVIASVRPERGIQSWSQLSKLFGRREETI